MDMSQVIKKMAEQNLKIFGFRTADRQYLSLHVLILYLGPLGNPPQVFLDAKKCCHLAVEKGTGKLCAPLQKLLLPDHVLQNFPWRENNAAGHARFIANFEGYLAEIYEVSRQILHSTQKSEWFHIGTDISSGTSFMQLKPIRDHPKRTSSLKVLWGPRAL